MKRLAGALVVAAVSASVLVARTPPKSELDKVQGSWIVTAASGQDVPVGTVVKLRVDGNTYQSATNGTVDESGTVSVNSTRVTVLMPAIRGAYDAQVKDGQLTGNWTQPGGTRPLALKRKS